MENDPTNYRRSLLARSLLFYGMRMHHRGQWWVHYRLRRALGANINADFNVSRAGLKWRLNPSNNVEADFFWLGIKDPWQIFHAVRFLSPGCVIFDIGANFGYYSCVLANVLKKNCTIYAFEPFPSNHARLATNITLNGLESCVRICRMGLSDSEGTASMKFVPDNTGQTHITGRTGDIGLTTIDDFAGREDIEDIAFIKIDVEGFELFVLRGGARTIRRCKPTILIEVTTLTLERFGLTAKDVLVQLIDYDYDLFLVSRSKLVKLTDFSENMACKDVFCVHPSRQATAATGRRA